VPVLVNLPESRNTMPPENGHAIVGDLPPIGGYGREFMTAPRSLRELFDQIGLCEVPTSDGTVIMEMPVDERVTNTAGGLQGGLIATMADVTAGQLAARVTPFGNGIATTDLFIRYLRPIKIGPARAVARILRTGKRSVVVQVDIFRGNDGEMAATATVNFAAVDQQD
jgi:uncharacterized protein (TIGR00369 family)